MELVLGTMFIFPSPDTFLLLASETRLCGIFSLISSLFFLDHNTCPGSIRDLVLLNDECNSITKTVT